MRTRHQNLAVVAAAATALLLSACGSNDSSTGADPTVVPTTTATPTATPTAAPTSAAPSAGAGCPATPGTFVPKGAEQKQVRDVDGDGKGDTLYLNAAGSAGIQLGIQTASGAQLVAGVSTAAPVGPSAVVIDPTGTGSPLDVIVQSREAYVYTISGCQLVPVKDSKGAPYVFGMGWSGIGTGMGCSTVTGRTGLVGLDAKKQADGSWSITRTAVIQTGTTAANGPSDTVKAAEGSAALKSAQGIVSCGDVTMAEDGVSVTG